jgi:hypothetical protein
MPGFRAIAAGVVLILTAAAPALAQHGKIDRLAFVNGDQLTCEIQHLARAELTVETDGLGTLSIEWNKVATIASPAYYEVVLTSGVRLFGPLMSPTLGQLQVGAENPVPFIDVVRITPVEAGFLRRLEGSIAAGYGFTQANERNEITVSTDVQWRAEVLSTRVSFDSLSATEKDVDTESRQTLSTEITRELGRNWFTSALVQLSRNRELGLDYRSVVGGVAGRRLVQSNVTWFALFGGVARTDERYVDREADSTGEALTGVRWDRFTFGSNALDLSIQAIGFVDVLGSGRFRSELNAKVSYEIVKDLDWIFSVFESFNSLPPEGEKKNDVAVSMSLGWTF